MSLPVFLVDLAGAGIGDEVRVDGDEGRHAVVVRRLRVGEELLLADGAGTVATASVTSLEKSALVASVLDVDVVGTPSPHVTVVQAIPKGDRADLAVEALTEVGVDRIVPWAAARCVAVWRGDRAEKSLARWRSTAREAAKQARRAWLPDVTSLASTDEVAALLRVADLGVVLHESASAPLSTLAVESAASVVLVVGPEGGIAPEELDAFDGATACRLGPTVLRTSTAGVAAVAALLARTGRWG